VRAGDVNADARIDVTDAVALLGFFFLGEELACPGVADVNADAASDNSDALYLLHCLYLGGPSAPGEC
jgi:hypothetical protein